VRDSDELVDHLLAVGVRQCVAATEQGRRAETQTLVRVGGERLLLFERQFGKLKVTLVYLVEQRPRTVGPREQGRDAGLAGRRRQPGEAFENERPGGRNVGVLGRPKDAGGEFRRRPRRDQVEERLHRVLVRSVADQFAGGGGPLLAGERLV